MGFCHSGLFKSMLYNYDGKSSLSIHKIFYIKVVPFAFENKSIQGKMVVFFFRQIEYKLIVYYSFIQELFFKYLLRECIRKLRKVFSKIIY